MLSRLHGSSIAYTPMIHSALFSTENNFRYRTEQFDLASGEEGDIKLDRPVVAQFCSNNKDTFLKAASLIAESGQVDAVDLNLVSGFTFGYYSGRHRAVSG
jgi:tRNA-dihydrouridine synthase 1